MSNSASGNDQIQALGLSSPNNYPENNPSSLPVAIDIDETEGDYDSAFEDDGGTETTSIASSVFSYVYQNGRRYHSDRYDKADYFLPNDDTEQDRLDLYHHVFLLLLKGKLHLAPLNDPQRILDVGTGTGIWAIEMATDYPNAHVIGTDISPIQPQWVVENCKFELDDLEETWTYPRNNFDYIHMRSLCGSFKDWDFMIGQAFNTLQPGGYLEYQDYGYEGYFSDGRPTKGTGTPAAVLIDLQVEAGQKLGRPLDIAPSIKDRMLRAGFVDVKEETRIWPIGGWPKDKDLKTLGQWSLAGSLESVEVFGVPLLTRAHGWTKERVVELCKSVKEDLSKSSKNKYYCMAWFVYGRKPLGGESVQ